ncbi:MAG: hypothetical protein OXU86_00325 [Thaumarchaeota archaeon]|nr:hypothetical protein [Nitrososphaerota archaeon]MDD9825219.1 hypothetical protein [Nitrososphaerota archaeon]
MEPTTAPEDYRRLEGARSIELYADPTPTKVLFLPDVSDWGELSRAGSAGRRVPIEVVKASLEYPRGPYYEDENGESDALPDITLEFTYAGASEVPLFEEWSRDPERYCDPNVYLWRLRVTDVDGKAAEWCFRAYMFGLSRHYVPGKVHGVLGVIDSQPLIEQAAPLQ